MHPADPGAQASPAPFGWETFAACVFIVVATIVTVISNWTGTAPIALGSLAAIFGAILFTMSVARTLRENAGQRIPHCGHPPVRPRRGDLLAGIGMPLVGLGSLTAIRASSTASSTSLLLTLAAFFLLVSIVPIAVHNKRIERAGSA